MSKRPTRTRRHAAEHQFDPVISQGILAILLVIVSILIILSFFGKAGTLGLIIDEWILSFLFGSLRYATPFFLLCLAIYIVKERKKAYSPFHIFGAILFFLSFSSLLHLRFEPSAMWQQAIDGHGGGIFGMPAWILKTYVGTIGSVVILLGFLLVSSLLLFHQLFFYLRDYYRTSVANMSTVSTKMKERFIESEESQDEEYNEEELDDEQEDEEEEAVVRKYTHQDDEEELDDEQEEDDVLEEQRPRTHYPLPPQTVPQTAQDAVWAIKPVIKPLPKLSLLSSKKGKPTSGDIEKNQKIIKDTFREFRIDVDMVDVRVGPTVTQYTLKPAKGIKVAKITSLSNDLALALAAHPLRIEAPIPGKSLVGIEVPNEKTALVSLREILESKEFLGRDHDMMIALGKDVAGKVWFADLPRMPHLLIAGATGAGKTVCMHTIILSLLFQNTAETLRMIMVDPKRVELTLYNGIPHLLAPVITNTKKTIHALNWTIGEMDRRFELLSQVGCRDIGSYNKQFPHNKLPYIIFFIDELADLMAQASNEVEGGIIRIAQLARAVGIHLIVATQRPSVDVITGLMKANIPGRISFSVASLTDSRTILDTGGAEKLLGRGDMLHLTASLSKPVRIQGAFISDEEVKGVVDYLKSGVTHAYNESLFSGESTGGADLFGAENSDQDPLFQDAKEAVVDAGKASASFLQRKLKVGYARAARILDELEAAGVIGPGSGAKPREILITPEEAMASRQASAGSSSVFHNQPQSTPSSRTATEEHAEDTYDDMDEELEEEAEENDEDLEEVSSEDFVEEDESEDAIDEDEEQLEDTEHTDDDDTTVFDDPDSSEEEPEDGRTNKSGTFFYS